MSSQPRVPSQAWLEDQLPAGAQMTVLLELPTSCAPSIVLTL